MLESLLRYIGDIQREGRVVTRRMRLTFVLWLLTVTFFAIAVIAAMIGGSILLAKALGAVAAALVIAGVSFFLGVVMLVALALMRRPRPVRRSAAANVLPRAMETLLAGAMLSRPLVTLAVAVAAGFLANRAGMTPRARRSDPPP